MDKLIKVLFSLDTHISIFLKTRKQNSIWLILEQILLSLHACDIYRTLSINFGTRTRNNASAWTFVKMKV